LPFVVRSTVSSWITTGVPSPASITSNSTPLNPIEAPRRMAPSVFSGASAPPPRCATILG
jgi:hypothetical protein